MAGFNNFDLVAMGQQESQRQAQLDEARKNRALSISQSSVSLASSIVGILFPRIANIMSIGSNAASLGGAIGKSVDIQARGCRHLF